MKNTVRSQSLRSTGLTAMPRAFRPLSRSLMGLFWLVGCSSGGGGGQASCPDLSGSWKVTAHCDSTLVGMTLVVSETNCKLSFAAPFDGFSGTATADGKITLMGPQSCTGDVTASAISLTCTPGTCLVTLAR